MNQGQAGLHSEDPGVGSCGLRGSLRWPLLERGAVGGCDRGAWTSGLPLQPLIHCLGLSGPALHRAPWPGHVWEKGVLWDLQSYWYVSSLSLSE